MLDDALVVIGVRFVHFERTLLGIFALWRLLRLDPLLLLCGCHTLKCRERNSTMSKLAWCEASEGH